MSKQIEIDTTLSFQSKFLIRNYRWKFIGRGRGADCCTADSSGSTSSTCMSQRDPDHSVKATFLSLLIQAQWMMVQDRYISVKEVANLKDYMVLSYS